MANILADASAFSNPFGAPSKGQWNLTRGVYAPKNKKLTPLYFFYETKDPDPSMKTAIDQITDQGGRRIAVYEYPYRDGQALVDLGRKGETFSFNIKFWGSNYQTKFADFLKILVNDNSGGMLTHPVRSSQTGGAISVRFVDYEFLHRYDEWQSITIKATFKEDSTDTIAAANGPAASQDSALRSALQTLTTAQATIQQTIFSVGALLLLPNAILSSMTQRLTSITSQGSALLGKLVSTFSSDASLQTIATQASTNGGAAALTSGTVQLSTNGSSQTAQLPPVYQVGFDPTTQAQIKTQISNFINANQITPQQAIFSANQFRTAISAAIAEVATNFENDGYDIMVQYRTVANSMQTAVEAAISTALSQVTIYTVPYPMSLRTAAFLNGLTADDQNAIEALNTGLASVNYVPAGTVLTIPAAS